MAKLTRERNRGMFRMVPTGKNPKLSHKIRTNIETDVKKIDPPQFVYTVHPSIALNGLTA